MLQSFGLAVASWFCWNATAVAQATPAETGAPPASSKPALPQAAGGTAQPFVGAGSQPPLPTTSTAAAEPRFLIVLDPAHGGADPGALLGDADPEKNYTLDLAVRLHAMLHARGIHSILTRSGDITLDNDGRATIANRSHASACILLHATATGNGVHLFTSSLPAAAPAGADPQDPRRTFLPWRTAQASYATQSLRLESEVNAALTIDHVPALLARTSLMPLDNMACPAVAIEIAPLDAKTPLTDLAYQQQIVSSLASALASWRNDWKLQP